MLYIRYASGLLEGCRGGLPSSSDAKPIMATRPTNSSFFLVNPKARLVPKNAGGSVGSNLDGLQAIDMIQSMQQLLDATDHQQTTRELVVLPNSSSAMPDEFHLLIGYARKWQDKTARPQQVLCMCACFERDPGIWESWAQQLNGGHDQDQPHVLSAMHSATGASMEILKRITFPHVHSEGTDADMQHALVCSMALEMFKANVPSKQLTCLLVLKGASSHLLGCLG